MTCLSFLFWASRSQTKSEPLLSDAQSVSIDNPSHHCIISLCQNKSAANYGQIGSSVNEILIANLSLHCHIKMHANRCTFGLSYEFIKLYVCGIETDHIKRYNRTTKHAVLQVLCTCTHMDWMTDSKPDGILVKENQMLKLCSEYCLHS